MLRLRREQLELSERIERVAYHEAGHAVAARLSGGLIFEVGITGEDGHLRGWCHAPLLNDDDGRLLMALAGVQAESLHSGRNTPRHRADLLTLLGEYGEHWGEPEMFRDAATAYWGERYLDRAVALHRKARRLLRANWRAVEAVAKALLPRRYLEGGEAHQLIDTAETALISVATTAPMSAPRISRLWSAYPPSPPMGPLRSSGWPVSSMRIPAAWPLVLGAGAVSRKLSAARTTRPSGYPALVPETPGAPAR